MLEQTAGLDYKSVNFCFKKWSGVSTFMLLKSTNTPSLKHFNLHLQNSIVVTLNLHHQNDNYFPGNAQLENTFQKNRYLLCDTELWKCKCEIQYSNGC